MFYFYNADMFPCLIMKRLDLKHESWSLSMWMLLACT